MIYLLVSIFGVLSIITLKLFLILSESGKYRHLKVASLFLISIGIFILISSYLLQSLSS